MKNTKRALSLLLCLGMLLGASACSQEPAQTQGGDSAGSAGTADSSGSDYSEKMTISWASIQVNESTDYNADELSKQWQEKFNVEWEMIPLTWDNWAEKLRIWINSGDMPDIATWDYIHGEFATYVEQGMIRQFPEDWKTRWPNVAAAYESTELGPKLDELFDGAAYCLPKPRFYQNKPAEVLPNHMGIYMRKDWMEAVGVEIKDAYTVNELMDIARKIKEQDPGNVGDRLAPIEVRTGNISFLFPYAMYAHCQSPADFYVGDDGKYHWGPADQETLEGLQLFQQAYQEGLIHPEFYTLKQNEDLEDFRIAGTAAITCEGGLAGYQLQFATALEQNLGVDPDEAMHFAVVLGNDGKYHAPQLINFWTANIFSPNMEDEKFNRIMDIFDYSASEEGQLSIRLGIEGTDWERAEDGTVTSFLPEGSRLDEKYPSVTPLYTNMFILSDDFDLVSPLMPQAYRETTARQYELRSTQSDETTLVPTDWTTYFQDSPSRRKVAFDYPTEYAQLILQEGDLEANWQAWVDEKMSLVQPVLDELDALLG